MGKVLTSTIEVHLDSGGTLDVQVDQRDYAAWEAHPLNTGESYTIMQRFLAWHAAKRAGQVSSTWEAFNSKECVQALLKNAEQDEDGEDEEGLDPGRKTATAG
jgi:hypothetical protein